jgi:hypothetical protein
MNFEEKAKQVLKRCEEDWSLDPRECLVMAFREAHEAGFKELTHKGDEIAQAMYENYLKSNSEYVRGYKAGRSEAKARIEELELALRTIVIHYEKHPMKDQNWAYYAMDTARTALALMDEIEGKK